MIQVDLQGNIYDCQIEQNHSVIATKFYSLEKQIELKDKEIERLNKIIERKNNRIQQLMKRTRSARIDKALELIYANAYDTERKECVDDLWGNIEELVDILKGSDKE